MTEDGLPFAGFKATYLGNNQIKVEPATNTTWNHKKTYVLSLSSNYFDDDENNVYVHNAANDFTFKSGDFNAPVITVNAAQAAGQLAIATDVVSLKDKAQLFLQVTTSDDSPSPVEVRYLVVAKDAGIPTPAQVKAGTILPSRIVGGVADPNIHEGWTTDLVSNTEYDVYFLAIDNATVKNESTQAEVTATKQDDKRVNDIIAPVVQKVEMKNKSNATVRIDQAAGTEIDMASTIVITFDEPVTYTAAADLKIVYADGTANGFTFLSPANYTIAGIGTNVLTITPIHGFADYAASLWKSSGVYTLTIVKDKVKDIPIFGTAQAIAENKVYNFTVQDYTGPVPVITNNNTKTQNATNIGTLDNITIDFGEAVVQNDGSAINANNIFFRDASSNLLNATYTFSGGGRYVTVDPVNQLVDNGAAYSIEFTSTLKDLSGNKLGYYEIGAQAITPGVLNVIAPPQWLDFSTKDETSPSLVFNPTGASNIVNNYNGLAVDVTSLVENLFDKNGAAINFADANFMRTLVTVTRASDNAILPFDITNNTVNTFKVNFSKFMTTYAAKESYTVSVSGLFDAAKNPAKGTSVTFTVQEYDAPTMDAFAPIKNAFSVPLASNLTITFNENVTVNAGNIVIADYATDVVFETIPVGDPRVSVAGKVVTINPAGTFTQLNKYYVLISPNAFADLVGNTSAAITSKDAWYFTALDNTKPTILSTVPADNSTTVTVPSSIVINFTEASGKIVAGPGRILIRETGNVGIADFIFNAQDASKVTITGTTVSIAVDPALFKYNGNYWVEIEANTFRDEAGNWLNDAGMIGTPTWWNFTINADPRPKYDIPGFLPLDNSNNVALDAQIKIKFTEVVKFHGTLTNKFFTIHNADGTAHSTVHFGGADIRWTWNGTNQGDVLTITPSIPLIKDKNYYVIISNESFIDLGGQTMLIGDELSAPGLYNFTTEDLTDPLVNTIKIGETNIASSLVTTPTGIAKRGAIVITFTEPVTIATPATAVTLTASVGPAPAFTAAFNSGTNTLTITPSADYVSEDNITVNIAANQIYDKATAPRPLAAGAVGKFIVLDYKNPEWTAAPVGTPGNNEIVVSAIATNEPTTIYYYYAKAGTVITNTAAFVKTNAQGSFANTAVPFTIKPLLGDYAYDVYFTAEDKVPNLMDQTKVNQDVKKLANIKTYDNVKPTLVTKSPMGTCIDALAANTKIKLKFTEKVNLTAAAAGAINDYFWVRKASDNVKVNLASVVDNDADSTVVITLAANMAENATYYVEINPSAIQDESVTGANLYQDYFFGPSAWTFTTRDVTAPLVSLVNGVTPAVGAVSLNNHQDLVMNFNEPVQRGVGYIYIYRVGSAAAQEIFNVQDQANVVFSKGDSTVTLITNNLYSNKVEYFVTMLPGVFKDKSCVPVSYAGIPMIAVPSAAFSTPGTESWRFFGKDEVDPFVVNVSPLNNATGVSNSPSITIEFSEIIKKDGGLLALDAAYVIANVKLKKGSTDVAYTVNSIDNAYPVTIPYAYNVTKVTLTPNAALTSMTEYSVTITGSKIADDANRKMAADYVWKFTTGDFDPPVVKAWNPVHNSSGNSNKQVVTITFDEPVIYSNNVEITNSNVDQLISYVRNIGGGAVLFDATINEAKDVITITPDPTVTLTTYYEYDVTLKTATYPLKKKEDYGIAVPASKILSVDKAIQFQVGDFTVPEVLTYAPNGVTIPTLAFPLLTDSIEINVKTTDVNGVPTAEKMKAGTGNVNIYRSNGQVFDIVPAANCGFTTAGKIKVPHKKFDTYTTYYVTFNAGTFTDVAGNILAGINSINTWRFSTSDDRKPTIDEFITPANGTDDALVNTNLVFRFSENVKLPAPSTGTITIYDKTNHPNDNGNIVQIVNVSTATFSGSNVNNGLTSDIVTVPIAALTTGHNYYVKIDAESFEDNDGYKSVGLLNNTDWTFTVGDNAAPIVVSAKVNEQLITSPAAFNFTAKAGKPDFSLTFNKAIALGTGKISLYQYFVNPVFPFNIDSRLLESINVSGDMISGNNLNFSFNKAVEDGVDYFYVILEPGVVSNVSANKKIWTGMGNPTDWTFVTSPDDKNPVFVSAYTNVNDTIAVSEVVATLVLEDSNGLSGTLNGNFKLIKVGGDTVTIDNSRVLISSTPNSNGFYTNSDTVTIKFVNELVEEADYYIQVASGVVTDNSSV
jgi:hypothetical protein